MISEFRMVWFKEKLKRPTEKFIHNIVLFFFVLFCTFTSNIPTLWFTFLPFVNFPSC